MKFVKSSYKKKKKEEEKFFIMSQFSQFYNEFLEGEKAIIETVLSLMPMSNSCNS